MRPEIREILLEIFIGICSDGRPNAHARRILATLAKIREKEDNPRQHSAKASPRRYAIRDCDFFDFFQKQDGGVLVIG